MNQHRFEGPRVFLSLILTAALFCGGAAQAQASGASASGNPSDDTSEDSGDASKKEARARFETAMQLIESGNYADAATELERSVELYPSRGALFNLGNSYQALHRYVDALGIFERLKSESTGTLPPDVAAALEQHLSEVRELVVYLKVGVEPAGSQVTVNGKPLKRGERPTLLDPGTYLVRASLAGYTPEEQSVELRPGGKRTLTFQLKPALAHTTLKVTPAGAQVFVDGKEVGHSPLASPLALSGGAHRLRVVQAGYITEERTFEVRAGQRLELQVQLRAVASAPAEPAPTLGAGFWIAAGGTALALGASAVTFSLASSRDSKLERAVADYDALPENTAQTTLDGRYDDLKGIQNERDRFGAIAWTTGGLGVAGLALTAALGWDVLFGGSRESVGTQQQAKARLRLWPTVNGLRGQF